MSGIHSILLRTLLLGTSCLSVAGLVVGAAQAQPGGGQVVLGTATITDKGPNSTVIDQKTGKAIINWNSFSIGAGGTVTFNQPNANAIALNRVLGGGSSSIYGNLLANGQVWIINQNGILFGKGSRINVGGLIATTADISDANFASGNYSFSGGTGASVVNQGTIRTRNGGSAVLSGASVQNQGLIQADTGTVVLGGSSAFTVDFVGDGLLKYAITAPAGQADNGQTGVSNAGTIKAAGGHVIMTARAAASVQDSVVNNTGMISATSAKLENGEVVLDGGDGDVNAGGTIDASGAGRGQTGGSVTITGHDITVADNTNINVSGDAGGGSVRIGGDVHGEGTLPTAANTHVGHAVIRADATRTGNGGTLVVWSNGITDFSGVFSATGGSLGGNGGFIETSGHALHIAPDAKVSTTAAKGQTGIWLLDPYNVTIASGATSNGSLAAGTFTPSGNNSVLNVGTLQTALNSTDVIVMTGGTGSPGAQTGDITVAAPIAWSSHTLTLDAYHSIAVNANLTATGTAGLTLKTNDGGTGGDYVFNNGASATFANTSEALTINGQAYTLLASMAAVQAINTDTTTLAGHYALANSLDATGVSSWVPIGTDGSGNILNSGNGFSGAFEGLGHTISNLTINLPNIQYVGLFGDSSGALRDIGTAGGSVTGSNNVGGLVGFSSGAVRHAFSSAAVSGADDVGGLIGQGSASYSYATGTVTAAPATADPSIFPSVFDAGGLIGAGSADHSYATGNVTGELNVGGLIGNAGDISYSYATGTVFAAGYNAGPGQVGGNAGGLAGELTGSVLQSFATGSITSYGVLVGGTGGLVGGADTGSSITQSYATGAVAGGHDIGGLLGEGTDAVLSQVYATGTIKYLESSGSYPNSEAGLATGGTVTSGYWNIETSGVPASSGGAGAALSTAQLQGALPSGFDSSVWGTGANLYPYLKWQFPAGTPQSVSGKVFSSNGSTPVSAAFVPVFANGVSLGGTTSGANGYFYLLVAPNALPTNNGQVLAGTALAQNTSGSVSNLLIYSGFLTIQAGATLGNYSANLATAIGGNSAAQNLINGLHGNTAIIATAGTLDISSPVNAGIGEVMIFANSGTVTESAPITAGGLLAQGNAAFFLTNTSNNIGTFAANALAVAFVDNKAFTVGTVAGVTGIKTTNVTQLTSSAASGGGIVVATPISASSLALTTTSGGVDASNQVITTGLLRGNVVGSVVLTKNTNHIGSLDGFTAGGTFQLVDAQALTVGSFSDTSAGGLVNITTSGNLLFTGAVSMVGTMTINAHGSIFQSATSGLTTTILIVADTGTTTLVGVNHIHNLAGNVLSGSYFSLKNVDNISVANISLSGAGSAINLQTTSGSIVVNGPLAAGTANLTSAASIYQGATAGITATTLTGSAVNTISLVGNNRVTHLGTLTASGNYIGFTNAQTLQVTGPVAATGAGSLLVLKTTANDLLLNGNVSASTVTLTSAGGIYQAGSAAVTASTLTGSAAGVTSLVGTNHVTNLGAFSDAGTSFNLNNAGTLQVRGTVSTANSGSLLRLATTSGDILISGAVSAAGTLNLVSNGGVYQNVSSVITAHQLTGSASGVVSLPGANHIATLGTFNESGTLLRLVNAGTLEVTGTITAPGANTTVWLQTLSGGDLVLNGNIISGRTVTLDSAKGIYQNSASVITTPNLTGSAAANVSFAGANHLTNIGPFSNTGSLVSFVNAQTINVKGAIDVTGPNSTIIIRTISGDINVNAPLNADTVTLDAAGTVHQSTSASANGASMLQGFAGAPVTFWAGGW